MILRAAAGLLLVNPLQDKVQAGGCVRVARQGQPGFVARFRDLEGPRKDPPALLSETVIGFLVVMGGCATMDPINRPYVDARADMMSAEDAFVRTLTSEQLFMWWELKSSVEAKVPWESAETFLASLSPTQKEALHLWVNAGKAIDVARQDRERALDARAAAWAAMPPYQPPSVNLLIPVGGDLYYNTTTGRTAIRLSNGYFSEGPY